MTPKIQKLLKTLERKTIGFVLASQNPDADANAAAMEHEKVERALMREIEALVGGKE